MARRKFETQAANAVQCAIDYPLFFVLLTALGVHVPPLFGYTGYEYIAYGIGVVTYALMWNTIYKPWRRVVELAAFVPGAWLLMPWADHPWWYVYAYVAGTLMAGQVVTRLIFGGPKDTLYEAQHS